MFNSYMFGGGGGAGIHMDKVGGTSRSPVSVLVHASRRRMRNLARERGGAQPTDNPLHPGYNHHQHVLTCASFHSGSIWRGVHCRANLSPLLHVMCEAC
jgi:hypothetical protein